MPENAKYWLGETSDPPYVCHLSELSRIPLEVDHYRTGLYALIVTGPNISNIGISQMAHPDSPLFSLWAARLCILTAVAFPLTAVGQQTEPQAGQQPQQVEPAAPSGQPATEPATSGWTTQSSSESSATATDTAISADTADAKSPFVLTQEQINLLARINIYLNSLENLEGRFVQTDPSTEQKRGRFYIKRPGRLRFDYSGPSLLRIVSDGSYLSIEDHDLKTVDKFPLDATPIQLLLGENINLARDALILDMRQDENAVALVIKDKSGNSSGQIQIFFKRPNLQLYEWVVTDVQGLDTRMQLADLVSGNDKSEDFFKASDIELENIDRN